MQSNPRISVVVPAYNHERFVGEAIDSVLAQNLPDFEVVVVDDGSRDGTAAVADRRAAADPRVRVVRQANGGSHAAINRGIAESTAPWIAILNSDDRWAPQRLSRLDDEARAGASFVVTGARLIDQDGLQITDSGHWWLATMRDFRARALELGPVYGLLYGNFTVSTSNFFFSRELANAVGPFRPLRFVPDWDWSLRAALHVPDGFRFLADEFLLDYRLHGENAILGDNVLGDCEINRIQRALLARFGAPAPLVSAVFRNQRDLRRNWRARGVAAVERYVRNREADVQALRAEIEPLRMLAIARQETIVSQNAAIDALRTLAIARQETIVSQNAETERLSRASALQGTEIERLRSQATELRAAQDRAEAHLRACKDGIREAESSITWRVARKIRRTLGIGWL